MSSYPLTLGIKPIALAAFEMCKDLPEQLNVDYGNRKDVYITAGAWYNGRETGVVISIRRFTTSHNTCHIVLVEHRCSDTICVDIGYGKKGINPPTHEDDWYEAAFEGRRTFGWDLSKVWEYVHDAADAFLGTYVGEE